MHTARASLLLAATLLAGTHAHGQDAGVREQTAAVIRAGSEFFDSLSRTQRREASYTFESSEREDWHYTPRRRPGVTLADLNRSQRELGWDLMRAALSQVGYDKARSVILLEGILGEISGRPGYRDPENYAFVFFGQPGADSPWGWRFEGHHLSLSFTVAPDRGIAFTPAFLGANPAVVPEGHQRAGWRVLDQEHVLAFRLMGMLDRSQKHAAVITDLPWGDIVTAPGREHRLDAPAGLSLGSMSRDQRAVALSLIAVYVGNIGREFAAREIAEMEQAGLDTIHFAWAGPLDHGMPHYYRLHGPTLLIEYDNRGNHVHSVWHDPEDLFGADLLRRHHDQNPH